MSARCCSRASAGTSVFTACVSMLDQCFSGAVFAARSAPPACGTFGRVAAGHVGRRRVLAQLQRADVGDDRPAIARRDLRR